MELTPFVSVRIVSAGGTPAEWAEGQRFSLPRPLLERTGWARRLTAAGDLPISADARVTVADAHAVREHAAFTHDPPASARLPFAYHRVPAWSRVAIGSIIGRLQRRRQSRWAAFPGWPLDLAADLLFDLARGASTRLAAPTPVLLTHDIDSPEGLANLRSEFLPIEEAAGARSVSYVVPCAWPLDHGVLEDASARGHEIGVHGYDHSNRTPFADDGERRRRLDAAQPFAERYRAVGYRAPSLLRTRALLRDVSVRYRCDSSIPTSGGLFPVPNNGCASARPYAVEGVLELPLSMPRDGSLRFLGYSAAQIEALWRQTADAIARSGGLVVLLTHCERRFSGNAAMLAVYRRFLDYVSRSERFRFVSLRELCAGAGTAA